MTGSGSSRSNSVSRFDDSGTLQPWAEISGAVTEEMLGFQVSVRNYVTFAAVFIIVLAGLGLPYSF
jgi:hypothetical protein